jgi:hypothetical protein
MRRRQIALKTPLGLLVAILALAACADATPALAATPHWQVITRSAPTQLKQGEEGVMTAILVNLGDEPVVATQGNPLVVTDTLPEGVVPLHPLFGEADVGAEGPEGTRMSCQKLPELRCTFVGTIPPFISLELTVTVEAKQAFSDRNNQVSVEGANAPPQQAVQPITSGAAPTPFGVERYELTAEEENGSTDLRAGSHPFQLTTTLEMNQTYASDEAHRTVKVPAAPEMVRNLNTTLPVGLVGNTLAVPRCSEVDFATIRLGSSNTCAPDTAVGVAVVTYKEPTFIYWKTEAVPVFNLAPAPGEPARFGFEFFSVPVTFDTSVKTGEGYAVEVKVANISQAAEALGATVTIWGVPGDPRHDNARGWECLGGGAHVLPLAHPPPCTPLGAVNPPAFLTLPTTCAQPPTTAVQAQSWLPGAALLPPVEPPVSQSLESCNQLPFEPSLSVAPDRQQASTPSGMTVELKVPQETTLSASGVAEADIKDTTLTLPEGIAANAGAADGLATCGAGESGFFGQSTDTGAALENELGAQGFTPEGVTCPAASKIGEVSVHTPLLENDLSGFLYLGQQDTNPFSSPLVLYLIVEDPVSGVRAKLAGEVKLTETGQLISVFRNAPPVPFQTVRVHLFDGPRASQSTPPLCGTYTAAASLAPSSGGPAAHPSSSFQISSGADGGACPSSPRPFAPSFQAGSTNVHAGAFTPFTVNIGRPDGQQALRSITIHLPSGLAAMIASVTPCPEPRAAKAECGPESLIGHSTALSGLGPDPVAVGGDVYLTGPYKGAPFGVLDVTHAEHVGPFNLGDIAVRSTITVDPSTAAATITSDPIPQIVKGAPSQIKALNVTVDRSGFQFNPTNCNPLAITGALTGYEGGSATVSYPFRVGECASMPFTPKLTASVAGHGSKVNGTTFTVRVESRRGQANIGKTFLQLPIALPSRLSTIQKACLAATFEANPASCGEGSNIGYAVARTPVLKKPFVGPAYLVSHGNAAFPDVEFVLQSEGITIVLDGKTDIKKGITYSRFETLPDAPVETFETVLPAGPHSALTANVPESEHFSLCKAGPLTMPTEITGQNGAVIKQDTRIAITGCSGVLGSKTETKLAKALKACRKKYAHNRAKRSSCERAARKKYGAKGAKKAAKHSTKR